MNPSAFTAEKVAGVTAGLFQDPSSGTASNVFPRFHPGFNAANAAEAVTGVNAAVQADWTVEVAAELVFEDEVMDVIGLEVVDVVGMEVADVVLDFVVVVRVVGTVVVAVPGIH